MRSLGLKIAAILVVSIIAVVVVATIATTVMLAAGERDRLMAPMARHVALTSSFLANGGADRFRGDGDVGGLSPPPQAPRPDFATEPPTGTQRDDLTEALQRALAKEGEFRQVRVIDPGSGDPVAALSLQDGRYLLFPFPKSNGPPRELWFALGAWLSLVVAGVVVVALWMAQRVTRPFALLERAIASVGPDGVLPHTPEVGSGEARQTAMALNALSDRLRSAMESRMRLVAAAGHDLRTPMTRMRLRMEFLSDEDRQAWLDDLDELDAIADSAIRLVKEEGAGEDRGAVPLDSLLSETVAELEAAGLSTRLVSSVPAKVIAGPLGLRRALRNLLINAATHGGGAEVFLDADATEARVSISDKGPGIPEEMLSQVFEPFFRANPGRMQVSKGAGLGLAIAREIVERFGGSIMISNRPEGGLLQVVRLRLAPLGD
ncbi:MAG: two-component sensor histidine kinase [Devosia sp.]|nr:two-component sensor histidine kinase [Devosia sp.]